MSIRKYSLAGTGQRSQINKRLSKKKLVLVWIWIRGFDSNTMKKLQLPRTQNMQISKQLKSLHSKQILSF